MANTKKSTRNIHVYKLKNGKKDVYIGTTNNVSRRTAEHKKAGKKFTSVKVVSGAAMKKTNAERKERSLIRSHKKKTGSLPKYNVSSTGQYQYGPSKTKKKQLVNRIKSIARGKR